MKKKKLLGGYNDWNLFEDYKFGWDAVVAQKTPIVCYREGSDEIVGVNWTLVNTKDDTLFAEMAENVSSKCSIIYKLMKFSTNCMRYAISHRYIE